MPPARNKRTHRDTQEEFSSQLLPGDFSSELNRDNEDSSESSEKDDQDGEDLFGEDLNDDYRENSKLDEYEVDEEAENENPEFGAPGDWRTPKSERRERDAYTGPTSQILSYPHMESSTRSIGTPVKGLRKDIESDAMPDLTSNADFPIEIGDIRGSLDEWVAMEGPQKALKAEFRHFLTTYIDSNGESVYGEIIKAMCEANGESLEVSYKHLAESKAHLAFYIINSPSEVLKLLNAIALEVVLTGFEKYKNIKDEIHVRITDLPVIETIRDLRLTHLNTLVKVSGMVTRRSAVLPQLRYAKYDCAKCGFIMGPYYQDVNSEIRVPNCTNCLSKGPFSLNSQETVYRNYQKLTLQESPGLVPPGRLPRQKEVICLWDLVDTARPGEEIEVTGIYRNNYDVSLNTKNGFPVFATVIEANNIKNIKDRTLLNMKITEEDHKTIMNLSKDPNIVNKIIKSIAPSIYSHEDVKTALALSMFSGVFKNPAGKHRIRGDINVLMVGDPGTAKSQFLKYVEKTAHRVVYATGQGASAVGLTASVHKDPVTREWTLEGGALVMADRGVCLIDEFDKMGDKDRTSIHEAMEQQSISISKAGIVTTLQARCSIIAAANPIGGRYNVQIPFSQNMDLTEPILSRFDILCVLRDVADPVADEKLAEFVCKSHVQSHPEFDPETDGPLVASNTFNSDIIPQEILRKYITYARERVFPKITSIDQKKLEKLYSDLRQESMRAGGIPITVRYLESLIRISEAFARMHLRDVVRQDDVDRAISVMVSSFVGSQKYSVKKQMTRIFEKYLTYERDQSELLLYILSDLISQSYKYNHYKTDRLPEKIELPVKSLEKEAAKHNIYDLLSFYSSPTFTQNFKYDRKREVIIKTF